MKLEPTTTLEDISSQERDMLVRYCTRFSSDPFIAEDLAHQTLLEAWQKGDKLHSQEVREYWLLGIARRICLQWARHRKVSASRTVRLFEQPQDLDDRLADDFDLEMELEREDLARLLDRALRLLPAETQDVLVQKYIEESPQADVAERLGLTEGAVEARLHRGKLALRRLLTTNLSEEAASFGLIALGTSSWQPTRIWCTRCGRGKLIGRFEEDHEGMSFKCPECTPGLRQYISHLEIPSLLADIKTYKPAFSRMMAWAYTHFMVNLGNRAVPCLICGRPIPLNLLPVRECWHGFPAHIAPARTLYGRCDRCGSWGHILLADAAICLPEGRKFLKEHPRIHAMPEREVEVEGTPAIVVTHRSLTDSAAFNVVFARDTYEIISIHGHPV